MESSARLLVRLGAQPEQEYPLAQEIIIIGREAINDLVINDPEVSRRHARIMLRDGNFQIEDLGSTNGTFVNGQRVTSPLVLYHGDAIELGKSARILYLGTAPTAQAVEAVRDELQEPVEAEISDESAEYYIRPNDGTVVVADDVEDEESESGIRRYFISCGCLILLLVFALGATVFILDQVACDLLYCGRLQPLWEAALQLFGRSLACPCS
jgi:hypothetical protein